MSYARSLQANGGAQNNKFGEESSPVTAQSLKNKIDRLRYRLRHCEAVQVFAGVWGCLCWVLCGFWLAGPRSMGKFGSDVPVEPQGKKVRKWSKNDPTLPRSWSQPPVTGFGGRIMVAEVEKGHFSGYFNLPISVFGAVPPCPAVQTRAFHSSLTWFTASEGNFMQFSALPNDHLDLCVQPKPNCLLVSSGFVPGPTDFALVPVRTTSPAEVGFCDEDFGERFKVESGLPKAGPRLSLPPWLGKSLSSPVKFEWEVPVLCLPPVPLSEIPDSRSRGTSPAPHRHRGHQS